MKKLIIGVLMLLVSFVAYSEQVRVYPFEITRVIDGDTVEFKATFMPPPLKPFLHLRVYGIDTPERTNKAKCAEEKTAGNRAYYFTQLLIDSAYKMGKEVYIELLDHDKYGGRVLGDVIIDNTRLSQELIAAGYAKPYKGGTKPSWCH